MLDFAPSPQFPRSSPLFESKPDAGPELMSSLTLPASTNSAGTVAPLGNEQAIAALTQRLDRVEKAQHRLQKSAEADRESTRSAVQQLTTHVDGALVRLQREITEWQTKMAAKHSALSHDVDSKLQQSCAEQAKLNDERHDAFTRLHTEQRDNNASQSARLEEQIHAVAQELSAQLEQVTEHAGDACQRVSECNKKFVDICVGLDDKIRHTQDDLHAHVVSAAQELAEELGALETRTESNAADLEQRLSSQTAQVDSKLDSDLARAEDRAAYSLQQAVKESDAKFEHMDRELERLETQLHASKAELGERVATEAEGLATIIEQRHEEHTAAVSGLADRLGCEASDLGDRIQSTQRSIAALQTRAEGFALSAEVKTQRMLAEMRMEEFSLAAQQLQTHLEEMQEVVESCADSVSEVSVEVATMEVALLSM